MTEPMNLRKSVDDLRTMKMVAMPKVRKAEHEETEQEYQRRFLKGV